MNSAATQRVIALVDMDCFYCQVETRLNPSLKGKPLAVVQYNQWKGGGIIAVNYEARDRGVTRYMRGDEAKEVCPEIILVAVPTIRDKADLSNYRDAGDEVAKIFSEFSDCVQRASIDEAYLDLTKAIENCLNSEDEVPSTNDLPNTFVVGYCDLKNKNEEDRKKGLIQWLHNVNNEKTKDLPDYQLAVGAKIVEKMRLEILNRTGFHCSAGIAHNKILAKLTASLHKPRRQTVLPQDSVPELYETLPIRKVRNLGGKLGKQVADKLSINYMSELYNFSLGDLNKKFDEKTSNWLYNIARGIDLEPVTSRLRPESIGCCKNFTGKNALTTKSEVEHWLKELATEISERLLKDLERNKRRAKLLTVSFCQETSMTRCGALNSYEVTRIARDALELLKKFNSASSNDLAWTPPIKFLGLAASKFSEEVSSIEKYLKSYKNPETLSGPQNFFSNEIHKEIMIKKERQKSLDISDSILKKVDESNSTAKDETISNNSAQPSFFLNFLNSKKDKSPIKELPSNSTDLEELEEREEEEEEETWISLSEVFPDIHQAEKEIVESLPEPLKKKFRERINSANGDSEVNLISGEILQTDAATETCSECGKDIPVKELPVHSDYHAALKLYSQLNKPVKSSEGGNLNNRKFKNTESLTKRKKKKGSSPTKKMKSLTSFFAPLTKE